jgi:hypothetical protein
LNDRALRAGWRLIGVAIVVLPLLPLPERLGAPDPGPLWLDQFPPWIIGFATILLVGAIAGRGAAGVRLPSVRPGPPALLCAGFAILTTVVAATLARLVFRANPHNPDEMAHLLHASAVASGKLALPVPVAPEAFLVMQTWITDAGWVSQYPPGHTLLLALGLLLNAAWLVNPVLSGVSTVLVFLLTRRLFDRRVAVGAAFLWSTSAWVLFTSASYMSHVPAVVFSLAAWVTAVYAGERARSWIAVGALIGLTTVTRPLDGLAAAVPIVVWMIYARAWRQMPLVAVGGLPIAVLWMAFNTALFGSPLAVGYGVLYGEEHGFGFHMDPSGAMFTPAVALSNLAVAIRRLHIYVFEWPLPALALCGGWALLGRPRGAADRFLAAAMVSAPLMYFFYWHSGFFMGPRFYFPLAPAIVILTARAWYDLRVWAQARTWTRFHAPTALYAATLAVLVWGALGVFPIRLNIYRTNLASLKLHPERELRDMGVERALVLVPTSWGNRIIADLWALGARPGAVERAYRTLDACTLDTYRRRARSEGWSGEQIEAALEDAAGSAAPAPLVAGWPDPTLRLFPDRTLSPACDREVRRDLEGFTLVEPLMWRNPVEGDGIVFARDLHERNGALFEAFPDRPVWRYAATPDGLPRLMPVAEGADGLR